MLKVMELERKLEFNVLAFGEAGLARRTNTFDDPKFTNVMAMQIKAVVTGDEFATAELARLNAQVDPYFRHKELTIEADKVVKTPEEKFAELNRKNSLFTKTIEVGRYFKLLT